MTSEKQLDKYPKEYLWWYRQASTTEFSIACDSPTQAESLRSDLYNFRLSYCREHGMNAMCKMMHNVSISVDGATISGQPL